MADEPSIDEILESLDHLLKDGAGRNDDISDDGQDETSEAGPPPESQEDEVQTLIQPDEEESVDLVEAVDLPPLTAEDAPELESSATDMDDAPSSPRMLLSEAMLVDNPQEHLPFGHNVAGEEQEDTASELDGIREGMDIVSSPTDIVSDAGIEKLLQDISDEVIQCLHARLGEVLPGMVAEVVDDAVRRHLQGLQPDSKG